MADATIRNVGAGQSGAGTTTGALTMPTHVAGDLVFFQVDYNTSTHPAAPSGWTALRAGQASGTALGQLILWRQVASGSETGPNVSFGGTSRSWVAIPWSVQNGSTVALPHASAATQGTSGTSRTHPTPGSADQPNELHFLCTTAAISGATDNPSPPGGYTEQVEVSSSTAISSNLCSAVVANVGAVAQVAVTGSSARYVTTNFLVRGTTYPVHRVTNAPVNGFATSRAATLTGVVAGDYLIAWCQKETDTTVPALTGGAGTAWTTLGDQFNTVSAPNFHTTWQGRYATAADVGATITFDWGGENVWSKAGVSAFANVPSHASPVNTSAFQQSAAAGTTATVPAVDPTTTLTLQVAFAHGQNEGSAHVWPSGTARVFDSADEPSVGVRPLPTSAASSTFTVTIGASGNWTTAAFALRGPDSVDEAAGAGALVYQPPLVRMVPLLVR